MRKLKLSALFVAVVILMLGFAVFLKLMAQRGEMAARGPLSVAEVQRLAAKWNTSSQQTNLGKPSQPIPPVAGAGETAVAQAEKTGTNDRAPAAEKSGTDGQAATGRDASSKSAGPQEADHLALKRCLTRAEKDAEAEGLRSRNRKPLGAAMISAIEFASTAFLSAGADPGPGGMHFCEAAQVAFMSTADWDTAKRLYRQALDYPVTNEVRAQCCLRLAWMEDDPEVASRLLELACPANEETPYFLEEAIRLAYKTGSKDVFDQFVARLQRLDPEQAQRFRSYPWPEEGR